jgi:hypothetical protein
MARLAGLGPDVLCPGHLALLTGEDAKRHILRSFEELERYVDMVEQFLREEGGHVDRTVERVKAAEWDPKSGPKQPLPAYLLNTQARVMSIQSRMKAPKSHEGEER